MKEQIAKSPMKTLYLPHKITMSKNEIFNENQIMIEFNKHFTNIKPKLTSKIPESQMNFK